MEKGTEAQHGAETQIQNVPMISHKRWERGQMLALTAVFLVAMIGFLALVIDVGNIYAQRRFMQNAADAGALAGIRALSLGKDTATIRSKIQEYAVQRNGAGSYAASILTRTVTVTVNKTFPTYFAGLVGVPAASVQAVAQAGYSFPGSWKSGLAPVGVAKEVVTTEHDIIIWDDKQEASDSAIYKVAEGERCWFNFHGGEVSNTELNDWIQNGYPGRITVGTQGTWINGTPGTKTSALQTMYDFKLNKIIFIPIDDRTCVRGVDCPWNPANESQYVQYPGNGENNYHVIGFGALLVTEVVTRGDPKYIRGRFQRYVAAQEAGGTFDSGTRVIGLQR